MTGMFSVFRRSWHAAVGGAVLLGVLVVLAVMMEHRTVGIGMLSGPPASDYTTVRTQNFGTWSYSATKSSSEPLHATINYRHDTVADILAYAIANRSLLTDVVTTGGKAEIAVTFVYPVEIEWFRTWAKNNQFFVSSSQLRVGAPGTSGTGTMSVSGAGDDPLPTSKLNSTAMGFFEKNVHGVFGAYGVVDVSRLSIMAAEPKVFLVDVTPAWVRQDLLRNASADLKDPPYVDLPFGWMERLGLQNFTTLQIPTAPAPVPTYPPTPVPSNPDEGG